MGVSMFWLVEDILPFIGDTIISLGLKKYVGEGNQTYTLAIRCIAVGNKSPDDEAAILPANAYFVFRLMAAVPTVV